MDTYLKNIVNAFAEYGDIRIMEENFFHSIKSRLSAELKFKNDSEVRAGLAIVYLLNIMRTTGNITPNNVTECYRDTAFDEIFMKNIYSAMNDYLVDIVGQELTIHGLKKTFRFWSEQEKSDYVAYCATLMGLLAPCAHTTCFGYGAVLGLARGEILIPHDDDLDILVLFDRDDAPTISRGLERVSEVATAAEYSVTGAHMSHRWVSKDGATADVFVGIKEGDDVSFFPGTRKAIPIADFYPPADVDFLGVSCRFPKNIERYAAIVYGRDWRSPNNSWRHNWDPSSFADIL